MQNDHHFLITVNALDLATRQYSLVCDTRLADQMEKVKALFEQPGHFGMNYRYCIVQQETGRAIATYYSDRLDLADGFQRNYRHAVG